jgi:hypothetical protein
MSNLWTHKPNFILSDNIMVFLSKADATNKNGTVKKGVNVVTTTNGSVRYVCNKEVKDKLTLKESMKVVKVKPVKETKQKETVEKKKTVKTPKVNKTGVKESLTENID